MQTTVKTITNLLQKRRWAIMVFWLGLTIIMVTQFVPNLFDATTTDFSPPEDSDAGRGIKLQETYFPETADELNHVIIFHSPDGSVLTPETALLTSQIANWAFTEYPDEVTGIFGYYIFATDPNLGYLAPNFVSDDLSTSFLSISAVGSEEEAGIFAEELREFIETVEPQSIEVYVTGFGALSLDTNEAIENDMATIDSIVIPIVFVVLVILLRNWRYFPVTLFPILMSILISFGLLERYIILADAGIQSFVPSVMISLTLGIGVDYNLFLLSRFREERLKGKELDESIFSMMKTSGHTVFTSGLTLVIAMSGLMFFPINNLSSVGIAITLSILVLLAINLTFTPALLYAFGDWVEKKRDPSSEAEKSGDSSKMEGQKDSKGSEPSGQAFGIWYRIGKKATKYNKWVLLIVLLATIPLSLQLLQSTPDAQTEFFAPRGSDSGKGFELLQDNFGPGAIAPVQLVITPDAGNIWTQAAFDASHAFIEMVIAQTAIESISISSYTWLGGQKILFSEATAMIDPTSPEFNTTTGELYQLFAFQYVSTSEGLEGQAATIEIILPVDPSSPDARDLFHELQEIAKSVFGEGYTYGFTGQTSTSDSSINETYSLFPLMILLVVVAIYALVGIMFKAAILPARLIATIGLTVSFIYGAATVVFEYDTFLNDIFPALDGVNVLFWMMPVMSLSIIIGLGMDYDIFTIERIKENIFEHGMDTDEAIAQGLDKTGRIITGAGVIMMISFGGMMFSSSYILMQFGFVLAFGVFLDTFVVRSLLVPAVMSLAEKANWWPSVPDHLKSLPKEVSSDVSSKVPSRVLEDTSEKTVTGD